MSQNASLSDENVNHYLQSEQKYKHLIEFAPDAIFIADAESGIILDTNKSAAELLGIPVEQIVGMHQSLLHPKEEAERYKQIFQEHVGKRTGTIAENVYVKHKSGRKIPVQISATVTHLQGKEVIYGIFRNITKQKALQRQLINSEKKYRELYDNAHVALYRTSLDGILLDCNRATLAFFGYAKDDVLNHLSVTNSYVDSKRREEFLIALKKNKRVHRFEVELRKKSGDKFWVSVSAELIAEHGYIEGVMHDITPGKLLSKAEQKILQVIMQGKSNKEVANILGRSVRTIEDHRAHIMHKLGAKNLVELTQIISRTGFNLEKS
ncbi:MAG: PAS domain S-box protein [Planctomycetes bacterium]|nr:PAS domain S-box protein [Planctomycetota bacterium]